MIGCRDDGGSCCSGDDRSCAVALGRVRRAIKRTLWKDITDFHCSTSFNLTGSIRRQCNKLLPFYPPNVMHVAVSSHTYQSMLLCFDVCYTIFREPQLQLLEELPGCADKSLARPVRKQATATKLGIYSTHSTRSSIHFLARCYNFCKTLKKNQTVVRPTRSPREQ